MAAFIESPVTRQALPDDDPVAVKVYVFICRIREHSIQKYCDKFLNLEPGTTQGYVFQAARGFGGVITLERRDMPVEGAPNPSEFIDPSHLAGAPNVNKFTVAIPIWRYKCGPNNILTSPEICWIQPILVFNNTTLVFQDRETAGFDAYHGAIGISPNPGEGKFAAIRPGPTSMWPSDDEGISAQVMLSTIVDFSPLSPTELLNFMTVKTGAPTETMPALRDDEHNLEKTTTDLMRAYPYFKALLESQRYTMDVVTLKQFRGFPDIHSAVYRSLSQKIYEYVSIKNVKYYDPKDVVINFWPTDMTRQILHSYLDLPENSVHYGSHPFDRIERELLDKAGTPLDQPPVVGESPTPFAFCFDAVLQPGATRTLYTYR